MFEMRIKKYGLFLLQEISMRVYKMASLKNLTIEDLKMFAKTRNIHGYKNISSQQLECTFTTPSTPNPT